jgi:hypothetical protein
MKFIHHKLGFFFHCQKKKNHCIYKVVGSKTGGIHNSMGLHYFDTQQVTSNHIKVKLKGWFTIKAEQLVHNWDKPFQVHASICKRGNDCQIK